MSAEFKALGSYAGPEIADSGLVLSLDAGNTKSYPGYGTAWTNLTGNGLNATIGNSPSFGFSNNGILTYSGSNSGATATGTSSLFNVGTGDFTLECWAKVSSFAPYSLPVSLDDNLNGNGIIYYLAASPDNFRTWIGNTANNSVTQITTNTWYHLVISRLSGTVSKYINGVLDSTHTAAGSLATGQSIKIGWRYDASYNFTGSIGSVRFYNAALTAAQVAQNYNATRGRYSDLPFSPQDISGLQLWLDASDSRTLFSDTAGTTLATADGTSVALWKDKSGNVRDANQSTASYRPVIKTGIQNSKTIVQFDGSNDYFALPAGNYGDSLTCFIVYKWTMASVSGNAGYLYAFAGGTSPKQKLNAMYMNGAQPVYYFGERTNTAYVASTTKDTYLLNTTTFASPYGSANLATYNNGSSISISSLGTIGSGGALNDNTIGADKNTSAIQWFMGDMAEILVYNSVLSTTQRQQVESYLNTKWKVY